MALSLRFKEGERVFIGNIPVLVAEILGPQKFKVDVQHPSITQRYTVTDRIGVQILPNVVVSAGLNERVYKDSGNGQNPDDSVKMVFKAPRAIEILREPIYRARQRGTDGSK